MVFTRTKLLMPKVEGKSHEIHSQKRGILLPGHDTPETNSNGTDINTTRRITFSRWRTMQDTVMPKNMHTRI